jgi:hypothetical protein
MVDCQRITGEHGPIVWRTAYRILANDHDAADCFQETFMSALKIASNRELPRDRCGTERERGRIGRAAEDPVHANADQAFNATGHLSSPPT